MNAVTNRIDKLSLTQAPLTKQPDFDSFWKNALDTCRSHPFQTERVLEPTLLRHTDSYRVQFQGYDETPLYGWYLVPKRMDTSKKLPCIVIYHGYPGGKGFAENYARWLMMDVAVFAVDVRGQGGETGNLLQQTHGMTRGWYSQGILDRDNSYYKAVVLDAVRAIDWAAEQPEVDPSRIAVYGESQGGGLALSATALYGTVAATVAHIPNMCWMDYSVMHSTGTLSEVGQLASIFPDELDGILRTLSYFDVNNLAERIRNPVLLSVGLKDMVCWPETIFAAFNQLGSQHKEILTDPFAGHSVSGAFQHKGMTFVANWVQA